MRHFRLEAANSAPTLWSAEEIDRELAECRRCTPAQIYSVFFWGDPQSAPTVAAECCNLCGCKSAHLSPDSQVRLGPVDSEHYSRKDEEVDCCGRGGPVERLGRGVFR